MHEALPHPNASIPAFLQRRERMLDHTMPEIRQSWVEASLIDFRVLDPWRHQGALGKLRGMWASA